MSDRVVRSCFVALRALGACAVVAAGIFAGCSVDQPCDPGATYVGGYACYAPPPPVDAASSDDADDDGATSGDGGNCSAAGAGFGTVCGAPADCPCGLDFCIAYGGPGYCTKTGCDAANGAGCPSGYSCVDLSAYGPGLGPTCVRM
jgi:hypothetical protein